LLRSGALLIAMYGLYICDLGASDLVWFTTTKALTPGGYLLERHHLSRHFARSPNVYVAESIAALVLQVGPLLDQAESRAQSSLSAKDFSSQDRHRIADDLTEGLLQRLTETSVIWVANPSWTDSLRPVPPQSG
jgi:signal transduction histidine kinase